jgi:hypothetical protein
MMAVPSTTTETRIPGLPRRSKLSSQTGKLLNEEGWPVSCGVKSGLLFWGKNTDFKCMKRKSSGKVVDLNELAV